VRPLNPTSPHPRSSERMNTMFGGRAGAARPGNAVTASTRAVAKRRQDKRCFISGKAFLHPFERHLIALGAQQQRELVDDVATQNILIQVIAAVDLYGNIVVGN